MTKRKFVASFATAAMIATFAAPALADTTNQTGNVNQTTENNGSVASVNNAATLTGSVLMMAAGNIGLNNASGIGNLQSNMLILHGPNVTGDQDKYAGTLNINQNINRVGSVTVQGSSLVVTTGNTTTNSNSSTDTLHFAGSATQNSSSTTNTNDSSSSTLNATGNYGYAVQSSSQSGSSKVSGEDETTTASQSGGATSATSGSGGSVSGAVSGSSTATAGAGSNATSSQSSSQGSGTGFVNAAISTTSTSHHDDSSQASQSATLDETLTTTHDDSSTHSSVTTYSFAGSGGPTASIDGSVGQGATGNVGFNNAAGAFNQQTNATLISTSLANSTAAVNLNQNIHQVGDILVVNSTASMGGTAFQGAAGNVGINQAAGALNQQSNALVIH